MKRFLLTSKDDLQTSDYLLKTELPSMKNVIQPLAKSVLIPRGSTAAA